MHQLLSRATYIIHLTTTEPTLKNFDITFVKKSILTKDEKEEYTADEQKRSKKETLELAKKYFVQIHYVPMESLQYIEKVLTRYGLKYEKGLNNLRWSYIVDFIRQDPKMFVEDGGWDFLSMEEKNKDSPYFRIVGEESHSEDSEWEEEEGEEDEEDEEEEANENGGKEEKKEKKNMMKKQNGLERMRERHIGNGEEESDDEDDEEFMPNDTSMTAEWSDFDDDVVLDKAVFSERDSDQSDRESERYARRLRRREMKQSKRKNSNSNKDKDNNNRKKTSKLVEEANTKKYIGDTSKEDKTRKKQKKADGSAAPTTKKEKRTKKKREK